MKSSLYGEPDYAFGQMMLTLRTSLGLTQAHLSEYLGISRQAVGDWEAGRSYPNTHHLKAFITMAVQQQVFPPGQEDKEIRALWKAAHQKVLLDEPWLSALLGRSPPSRKLLVPGQNAPISVQPGVPVRPASWPQVDWGEALDVPTFYGREQELATLSRWIVEEDCRIVSVLGLGGIGKSALVVNAMHQMAAHFEVVLFRSLRDAPSCETLLDTYMQVLAPEALARVPKTSLEQLLSLLLEELRTRRVLLVLDNLETLLEKGDVRGHLLSGYEGYEHLLRRLSETAHQSCLLLTSREEPAELRALDGNRMPVRSLHLRGLNVTACEQLLAEHEVVGSPEERVRLVQIYEGNPLALKIVTRTIADLFGGAIDPFLAGDAAIFGGIADMLDEQWARLSRLEQTVLYWLAIVREPVTIDELLVMLAVPLPRIQLLEAVDSLYRRSLIERGQRRASFTLQAVVLEYVTAVLIEKATKEIQQQQLDCLLTYGLVQVGAKEYVRQTQQRLLLVPILAQLYSTDQPSGDLEQRLLSLLNQLRNRADYAQGYGPSNLIALLRELRGHLRGVDLSRLVIRGTSLQGIEMQDASLAGATLRDTVFTEALDATLAVAISNDGQYWAAGGKRGDVCVWREGGKILHLVWQAHTDDVYALAFSPDGHTLATSSWDSTIKLWSLEQGTLLWTGWHADSINSVAFAPDGRTLASGGDDALIRIWEVASGVNVQTLASQSGAVYALAWGPDGSLLASGSFDGSIRLWQMQERQPATCVQILTGHTNWVLALAFAPDGVHLASAASWEGTVKLWEVASGRCLQTLAGHTDRVRTVAWSRDGRIVASAGFDKTIWLWEVERGRYRAALHGHTAVIYNIAFTPDNSLLSGSEDGTLRVWDVESGQCVRIVRGYAVTFYDLAWSPTGTHLASAGTDTCVTIWEVTGGTRPRVLRGHHWITGGVTWSPDGRLLASNGWDNAIRLWDPVTGVCLQVFQDPDCLDTIFCGQAWSPSGNLLANGSYMRGVQVWDVETCTRRWVGYPPPTRIRCVAWNPDSTRLASGGDDGSICLWEAFTGLLLARWQRHHGVVTDVAWSPDGTKLASGGSSKSGGELFVWDAHSGECLQAFTGHAGNVFTVAWSPSAETLISGESDGSIRWWNVQSGECLRTREGHRGTVRSLKISPDGHILASSGDDSTIRLWGLENGELLQTLRRDRPYERLNITGTRGLTAAQKTTLYALGAIEENEIE